MQWQAGCIRWQSLSLLQRRSLHVHLWEWRLCWLHKPWVQLLLRWLQPLSWSSWLLALRLQLRSKVELLLCCSMLVLRCLARWPRQLWGVTRRRSSRTIKRRRQRSMDERLAGHPLKAPMLLRCEHCWDHAFNHRSWDMSCCAACAKPRTVGSKGSQRPRPLAHNLWCGLLD